jgi:hypothetical protein
MTIPTYDTDFYAWTQQQAAALRDRTWMTLDVEHLRRRSRAWDAVSATRSRVTCRTC